MITRVQATAAASRYAIVEAAIENYPTVEGAFDHVITDPPYAARTQDNTRRGRTTRTGISEAMPLGFEPANDQRRAAWANWIAHAVRRWAAVFSDHESSIGWAACLERAGLIYVRTAIWVRRGGAPQFTGDRPAAGHECIVLAHKGKKGMRWNGRGKIGVYEDRIVRGETRIHPAQKPLSLMRDIVGDFADAGDAIVDPFCGSGTTLVAAKNLRVGAVGIDVSSKFVSYAARRVSAAALGHVET